MNYKTSIERIGTSRIIIIDEIATNLSLFREAGEQSTNRARETKTVWWLINQFAPLFTGAIADQIVLQRSDIAE